MSNETANGIKMSKHTKFIPGASICIEFMKFMLPPYSNEIDEFRATTNTHI